MKNVLFILSLIIVVLHISCNIKTIDKKQTVNPILGDLSFIHKFGHQPDAATGEDLRIKTHLEYVENLLRQKNISGLSPELRQKRKQLLDLLHNYWTTGVFPRNYDYKKNREPCFIDRDDRICAVGYLIEKTAGRQVAKDINSKHKYDRILAMNDNMVDSWIKRSGLSKEECAMIQPAYSPAPTYSYNYISPTYGISSSVLGGLNLSLNTLNGIQLSKGANNKTIAIVGLITGAGQTILGASMFPKTTNGFYGNTTNESRKTLSLVNIGLGTTTIILSTWNLITNRKPNDKKMTWNLNTFETQDNNIGMAFTLRRKL
jgi:hypothetical protein